MITAMRRVDRRWWERLLWPQRVLCLLGDHAWEDDLAWVLVCSACGRVELRGER